MNSSSILGVPEWPFIIDMEPKSLSYWNNLFYNERTSCITFSPIREETMQRATRRFIFKGTIKSANSDGFLQAFFCNSGWKLNKKSLSRSGAHRSRDFRKRRRDSVPRKSNPNLVDNLRNVSPA